MLAERLLEKTDFDMDSEIRTLEHLKKRFGENNLHNCEVGFRCCCLLCSMAATQPSKSVAQLHENLDCGKAKATMFKECSITGRHGSIHMDMLCA